jgi:dTDP-4-dehydrorhamnose 3,5-epimerase
MRVNDTHINGVLVFTPTIFQDSRGYFFETYKDEFFKKLKIPYTFVQDNESMSHKGTVRGLHFQAPPFAQAKLVRVIKGKVLDVAVDIRKDSPTYGKHISVILSEQNKKQMLVPEGFAHGFAVLEDQTIFSYKCSAPYNKESEVGLLWNDFDLGIDWQVDEPNISKKDLILPKFSEFKSPF